MENKIKIDDNIVNNSMNIIDSGLRLHINPAGKQTTGKERLERATLMAMQGILANAAFAESNSINLPKASFKQAKATLDYIDSQFANQETQEQEPKRGDVVWVRDKDEEAFRMKYFMVKLDNGLIKATSSSPFNDKNGDFFIQMTTKNPYTDGN